MESNPETRPRPRRWLRWLSIIGLLMAVLVWLAFRDEALEPADDLLPQRPSAASVPEEQNGWVQWQKACDSLPEISKEERARAPRILFLDQPDGPGEEAEYVLSDDLLVKLEAALMLPVWKNAEWQTIPEIPKSGSLLSVLSWIDGRMVQSIRQKRHEDILRLVDVASRFGRRTVAGGTSEFNLLEGLGARSRVPWLLVQVDFSEPELQKLAEILSAEPISAEDLAEVMRHEHRMLRNLVLELPASSKGPISKFIWKKHATANLAASICRARVNATLEGHFRETVPPDSDWASRFRPNSMGRALADSMNSNNSGIIAWSSIATHRCVRVLVALHRYWKATGTLPDDLSALVPRYLPEVPADPFDLKPLKWDKAKRVIYSIGWQKASPLPDFTYKGKPSAAGWLKLVAPGGLGVRFRRPEEGPDVPVKQSR